jgi:tetratricopeptide (TPR) repeat protein
VIADLTDFLREWKFDGSNTVRFLTTLDGREIMQVRLPLGVEQLELEGRPDGLTVEGRATALDLYRDRLEAARMRDESIELSRDDFNALRTEAILYYQRYLILFQLGEYSRTVRDTEHNLSVCDLVESCYQGADRVELLQYRPYILRVNTIALAMQDLNIGRAEDARGRLEKCVEIVKNMSGVASPVFEFEKLRALQHLDSILEQIRERSLSKRDLLERELHDAVEHEDYERAARVRDQIRGLDTEASE